LGQTHDSAGLDSTADAVDDASLRLDTDWRCSHMGVGAAGFLGCGSDELVGSVIWSAFPAGVGDSLRYSASIAMESQRPTTLQTRWNARYPWVESTIRPDTHGVRISFADVTARHRVERMNEGHREVLTGIAAQHPLKDNLTLIALLHEELNPGALCSILLLAPDARTIAHGAAPNLPDSYNAAINGAAIGNKAGSCGTALWRRERIVVADIATDPLWTDYKDLALGHGLLACWSTPVFGSNGQCLGTFAVYYREIREPSAYELDCIDQMLTITTIAIESAQLVERVRQRDGFFDLSLEIYCVFDTKSHRILQANPAFTQLTGFSEAELASRPYSAFVHAEDLEAAAQAVARLHDEGDRVSQVTYRFQCKDGNYRWLCWESVVGPEGKAFAVGRDVTDRLRAEADLAHAASHDAVTGLPHRVVFEKVLVALLGKSTLPVWVLLIGLDRFQVVNEFMGHFIGDDVLRRVASRLREALAGKGHVARFAGDEFAVATACPDRESVLALAERLRAAVALPIDSNDYRLSLSASVGISHSPEHGVEAQDLLSRAQAAMNRAKRQGKDCVCEFSVEEMEDTESRLILGRALRGAVEHGEMELHYQPQRDATGRTLTGFEALLRWISPELGRGGPARHKNNPHIGWWVIDEACRQARAWLDQGHRDFEIAVNVSAQELQRPGLTEQIRTTLRQHDLPASVLSIELTESSLMENVERVRKTLAELQSLGTKLSLDDFGTGYSSLAYLKQFPVDKLKIDQRFVRSLPGNEDDAAIAQTIVVMGHQLRMKVAAEGVETEEQAEFLRNIGCDELQGFHLGRPVAPAAAAGFFPPIAEALDECETASAKGQS
jgi:diguanylate cyclase (GGDEF)-like protein/PAS domain S-box-containing protein